MKVVRDLLKLVGIFWKSALLSIFLGWATVISWVALISTSAYLISYAALQPSIAELQVAIVGVRFFGISRGVFRYLERLVSHTTTFKILTEMRVSFFTRLEKITPAGIKDYYSGDLLARIVDDIENLQDFYVRVVYPPIVAVLSTTGVIWFFGNWSLKFGLTILGFHMLVGVLLPLGILYWSKRPGRELVENGAAIRSLTVDGLKGIAEIAAFGAESVFLSELKSLGKGRISYQRKMHLILGVQNGLIAFFVNISIVVILLLAIPMVNNGSLDGKLLAVIVLGTLASFESVTSLPAAMQNVASSIESGKRLSNIFDNDLPIPAEDNGIVISEEFSLRVEDLTFTYPGDEKPVLQGVNLDLPKGKKMGIVGVSGVGKSTLLNLLLRHWEFSAGKIMVNGEDIRKYLISDLRKHIAIVNQNIYLFNESVYDNLRLGNPEASDQDVIRIAKLAGAHEFVDLLPAGYNTNIGEQGGFISGGEAQRLGLTRTLLREASLFLLDEPFAHLDPISRNALLDSTLTFLAEKSVLLVTHQIEGLAAMDEILVFDEGRVAERGTHTELIQANGMYSEMWRISQEIFLDQ